MEESLRRIFAIRSPLSEHQLHSHDFFSFVSLLSLEGKDFLVSFEKPEESRKFVAIRSSNENENDIRP